MKKRKAKTQQEWIDWAEKKDSRTFYMVYLLAEKLAEYDKIVTFHHNMSVGMDNYTRWTDKHGDCK